MYGWAPQFNLFTPRQSHDGEGWFDTLTFKSVYEVLWYYHLSETSVDVMSHGTIIFLMILQFGIRHFMHIMTFATMTS